MLASASATDPTNVVAAAGPVARDWPHSPQTRDSAHWIARAFTTPPRSTGPVGGSRWSVP